MSGKPRVARRDAPFERLRAAIAAERAQDSAHRSAQSAVYAALGLNADPDRTTWPDQIRALRERADALAAEKLAPLTRQQIDDVMAQHYPLSSLLREEVGAFEACVRDIERLHGIGA